ncbi:PspC domain-containing protein [Fulvivirga lutea]|uniref:PspC domain-containing protein n=1 Tax=Fulvivirga lutea TaxID=2810512 RepID=A0A975A029_9BACT|nr:PspC domain-containing protein [Fulvivirga lutea]QSE96027.1 PspC domain-containing protein [Fulvivirga lutea]
MKKNISINISGIIFHIEEDAFDQLKDYLDSINRYFSSFNDSQEIISDIEGRIAEIFLSKLNDDKQVITLEDVESLKSTMGSIKDFQSIEEDFAEETAEDQHSGGRSFEDNTSKKLYRDEKRKLLAGLCAGIAHYFNVDPLWVRLLFFIILIGTGGILIPVYLVMWAVVPGNKELPGNKTLKKMFRDGESKVIAGVASGVANYFGVDVVIVRVIFVISLLVGGFGFLTYILLWIVLPEAKSVSDKVQMKGDPVTLSNIESNIKQNLNVKEDEDESIFVKLLLFPFRLVALIIEAIGKILGPFARLFVDMVRIIIGAVLVFTGIVSIISLVIALGAIIGVFSSDLADISFFHMGDLGVPLEAMTNGIPGWTIAAAVAASVIPFFFMILLGSSIIARRITFSSNTGWTLFAAFVVSLIVLAINVPMIAFNFSEEGEYKKIETYDLASKTAVLKLNRDGYDKYHMTNLKIRGHAGPEYRLEQVFESQGRSRSDAEENARMVKYNVEQRDSLLYFDSNFRFERHASFRAQRLNMTLYVPYGAKFMMDEDLRYILENTIYRHGYRISDMENNIWTFSPSGLECLTCSNYSNREKEEDYSDSEEEEETVVSTSPNYSDRDYDKSFRLDPFDRLEVEGAYTMYIEKSSDYGVYLVGPDDLVERIRVDQDGEDVLITILDYNEDFNITLDRDAVKIIVKTPGLTNLEVTGATQAYMSNFNLKRLKIDLLGASSLKADILVDDLEIELTGASELDITGRGNYMKADAMGASNIDAFGFKVKDAKLEAEGVSSIKAYVTDNVTMEESFISRIKVRGGAKVNGDIDRF